MKLIKNSSVLKFSSHNRVLSKLTICFLCFSPCVSLAQQQVSIQVEGAVKPHCAFENRLLSATQTSADMVFTINPEDKHWETQSRKLDLALSCNAPFTLAARSVQGSLKNTASQSTGIGGGFSNEIAYNVALNIATEDGASPLVLACQSREMANANTVCGVSSGTNTAIGYGAGIGDVAVTLSGSAGFPIRGRYQDTIVLALAFQ